LVSGLLSKRQLNLENEKVQIKSMNMKERLSYTNSNSEILEINMGIVKSYPEINSETLKTLNTFSDNKEYDYEISLLGRKIENENEEDSLDTYLQSSDQSSHYISPLIFHDEESFIKGKSKITHKDTVFSFLLRNPFFVFFFIVIGYYIYPSLWNKDYFMALSENYNNKKVLDILKSQQRDESIYDYVNYRRGLYVSVRSNFS
jgi:hypothetical protein